MASDFCGVEEGKRKSMVRGLAGMEGMRGRGWVINPWAEEIYTNWSSLNNIVCHAQVSRPLWAQRGRLAVSNERFFGLIRPFYCCFWAHSLASVSLSISCRSLGWEWVSLSWHHTLNGIFFWGGGGCFQQPCYFHAIAPVSRFVLFTQQPLLPLVEPPKLRWLMESPLMLQLQQLLQLLLLLPSPPYPPRLLRPPHFLFQLLPPMSPRTLIFLEVSQPWGKDRPGW